MAKRFMYTAASLLALAAAYHLGAVRTGAQGGGTVVGLSSTFDNDHQCVAVTSNGDVWRFSTEAPGNPLTSIYMGNIFGGPVNVEPEGWGSVKNRFR